MQGLVREDLILQFGTLTYDRMTGGLQPLAQLVGSHENVSTAQSNERASLTDRFVILFSRYPLSFGYVARTQAAPRPIAT